MRNRYGSNLVMNGDGNGDVITTDLEVSEETQ